MLCFCKNAEFPKFLVQVFHKRRNTGLDGAEIVVVKFLSFRRSCAEKSSARIYKIFSFIEKRFVDKEIFLFGTDGGFYGLNIRVAEKFQHTHSLSVYRFH